MFLTLPTVDKNIPVTIDTSQVGRKGVATALVMSESRMISDGLLRRLSAQKLSAQKLNRTISQAWEDAVGKDYVFRVIAVDLSVQLSDEWVGNDETTVSLVLSGGKIDAVSIGGGLEKLEGLAPNLGRMCNQLVHDALTYFGMPCCTLGAISIASHLHWMGEEGPEMARETYADDGGEPDDIPDRKELFGDIPAWAFQWERKGNPSAVKLKRMIEIHGDDEGLSAALGDLLALKVALSKRDRLPRMEFDDMEPFTPPVWLEWNAATVLQRLYDDWYQYVVQGECCDWGGSFKVELNKQSFSVGLKAVRHTGQMFKALDRLIAWLIKESCNGH